MHYHFRSSPAVEQFKEGAGYLWTVARANNSAARPLFVQCGSALTFDSFQRLYDVQYSDAGSNHQFAEDNTIYTWELFLQKCEGNSDFIYSYISSFVCNPRSRGQ